MDVGVERHPVQVATFYTIAVGCDGCSEVGQGEQHSTHHYSTCVAVLWSEAKGACRVVLTDGCDIDAG